MTAQERQDIFSKDYLDRRDICALLGLSSECEASRIMTQIRLSGFDRLHIKGKIHVQDYLDFYKLPPDRYLPVPAKAEEA